MISSARFVSLHQVYAILTSDPYADSKITITNVVVALLADFAALWEKRIKSLDNPLCKGMLARDRMALAFWKVDANQVLSLMATSGNYKILAEPMMAGIKRTNFQVVRSENISSYCKSRIDILPPLKGQDS